MDEKGKKSGFMVLLGIGVIVLVVSVSVGALVIKMKKGREEGSNKGDNKNNTETVDNSTVGGLTVEDLDKVEGIKEENIEKSNFLATIESCKGVSENFNLSETNSNNMEMMEDGTYIQMDTLMVVGDPKEIEGNNLYVAKNTSQDGAPSIGLTIYSRTLSEDDSCEMAYDIIEKFTSKDIASKLKDLHWGEDKTVADEDSKMINITKSKAEYEKTEYLDEAIAYTFGVDYYTVEEDNYTLDYNLRDYDKQLFLAIPMFKAIGITDIVDTSFLIPMKSAQGVSRSDVVSYRYEHDDVIDDCSMTIISEAVGEDAEDYDEGEQITTVINCNMDNESELINYSITSMTKYNETKEGSIEEAIQFINEMIWIDCSLDNFIESGKEELADKDCIGEYIYIGDTKEGEEADISGFSHIIILKVYEEEGVGYYTTISMATN